MSDDIASIRAKVNEALMLLYDTDDRIDDPKVDDAKVLLNTVLRDLDWLMGDWRLVPNIPSPRPQ